MKAVKEKDNYIMHAKYDEHFKLLTDSELGRLIRDVNNYVINGVLPQYSDNDRVINMAFSFMKATIDIEKKNYIEKCKTNKRNGQKGGAPKGNKNAAKKQPNGYENNPIDNDIDIENDIDIDIDNDIDIKNKKSVCDKSARAKEFYCHLGSDYKSESCFYCMKKQICPNKESTEFRLNHRNETFDEWNKRHEDYREQLIEDLKSRGKDPDIELIDYDWLNEDNDID
mgnify:FL=1|jgi:hypothetical protein